jgi:hypothetical protein
MRATLWGSPRGEAPRVLKAARSTARAPDRRHHHQRAAVVEPHEVLDVGERGDLVVWRARRTVDLRRRIDRLIACQRIGVQLDDAERGVGDEQVVVAVLLVRDQELRRPFYSTIVFQA